MPYLTRALKHATGRVYFFIIFFFYYDDFVALLSDLCNFSLFLSSVRVRFKGHFSHDERQPLVGHILFFSFPPPAVHK